MKYSKNNRIGTKGRGINILRQNCFIRLEIGIYVFQYLG